MLIATRIRLTNMWRKELFSFYLRQWRLQADCSEWKVERGAHSNFGSSSTFHISCSPPTLKQLRKLPRIMLWTQRTAISGIDGSANRKVRFHFGCVKLRVFAVRR